MLKLWISTDTFIRSLLKNQSGASMIDYSVLIGLILAATVGTVVTVGTWVSGEWTGLNTTLQAN